MGKNIFSKKYPALDKYIKDDVVRTNMLNNADLLRKYHDYEDLVNTFIKELDNHFDPETIYTLIQKTILKMPDMMLTSFIKAYLNSSEEAKANNRVVNFYNKTLDLGHEAVNYIEENGIITSRKYKKINEIILDQKYEKLKTGKESFRGCTLEEIYYHFTYEYKKVVIDLLENKVFYLLEDLFSSLDVNLPLIIHFLTISHIDSSIINVKLARNVGEYKLMILILSLINHANTIPNLIDKIKLLIELERYNLLIYFASLNDQDRSKSFVSLVLVDDKTINLSSDEKIIRIINNENLWYFKDIFAAGRYELADKLLGKKFDYNLRDANLMHFNELKDLSDTEIIDYLIEGITSKPKKEELISS